MNYYQLHFSGVKKADKKAYEHFISTRKKELFLIPSNLIVYKKVAIIYETVIYYTWL